MCENLLDLLGTFQSTLPVRGETPKEKTAYILYAPFQSTLPVRGETGKLEELFTITKISIHSPRAGRDANSQIKYRKIAQFQSTLPVRGETDTKAGCYQRGYYFNPLSPCGERPKCPLTCG
mgnify:CR=1 FL=1